MYKELVGEFESKKSTSSVLEIKSQKLSALSSKICKLKAEKSCNEQHMISFKRELSNIAISMTGGKELEDAVRSLYKKYVREEKLLTHTGGRIVSKRTLHNVSLLIKEEKDSDFDDYNQGKSYCYTLSVTQNVFYSYFYFYINLFLFLFLCFSVQFILAYFTSYVVLYTVWYGTGHGLNGGGGGGVIGGVGGGVGSGNRSSRAGTGVSTHTPLPLPVLASGGASASAADVVRDVEEALIDAAKEVSTSTPQVMCVRADMYAVIVKLQEKDFSYNSVEYPIFLFSFITTSFKIR